MILQLRLLFDNSLSLLSLFFCFVTHAMTHDIVGRENAFFRTALSEKKRDLLPKKSYRNIIVGVRSHEL